MPLMKRVFDGFDLASAGAGEGVVEAEDGAPIDLSQYPGAKRLLVSFALAGNSKVSVTKTRGVTTKTTALKLGDTLVAGNGYGPIAVPVSDKDTVDIVAISDVGFDWIIIEISFTGEE